ncbi:MAG TPA: outer membrane protein assembly factor BamE [Gammaproteobacteria bacterium]|nr:outer membrane protein assembly factor BamE [Gammaproteobacteria bacterium]
MVRQVSKYARFFLILLIGAFVMGCTTLKPYKMKMIQGNVLTEEKVGQLSVGMTEDQVLFLLGTPVLQDSFHQNRWDYVYYVKPGYEPRKEHALTVYFENGKVSHFKGNLVNSGS